MGVQSPLRCPAVEKPLKILVAFAMEDVILLYKIVKNK
jgi:hypothetical protein